MFKVNNRGTIVMSKNFYNSILCADFFNAINHMHYTLHSQILSVLFGKFFRNEIVGFN